MQLAELRQKHSQGLEERDHTHRGGAELCPVDPSSAAGCVRTQQEEPQCHAAAARSDSEVQPEHHDAWRTEPTAQVCPVLDQDRLEE